MIQALLTQGDIGVGTLLAFVRFSAFFTIAPLPGGGSPVVLRLALSAGLAWSFAPSAATTGDTLSLFGAVMSEVALGLLMGFLLSMVLYTFVVAGESAAHQMGLANPSMFISPSIGSQLTIMGGALFFLALAIFAVSDGPARMLALLDYSLDVIPPGDVIEFKGGPQIMMETGRDLFIVALRAASPLIAAVFAAQMMLAVLARAVPTMNLFIEGPGLTVAAGVIGLIAATNTYAPFIENLFANRIDQIALWIGR
jgi:flagellar biosynthetic protein FliR